MDIQLTPDLQQLVQRKLETGRYSSASKIIREALHLMLERDRFQEEVRARIAAGLADQHEGRMMDGEAVFDRLEAELDAPQH